jgi:hypothetical protein
MQKVNNTILYGALMSFWLAAIADFRNISIVSGIVNVMCVVVPATAYLHILDFLGEILIIQWAS